MSEEAARQVIVDALAGRFPADRARSHLAGMNVDYLVSTTADAVATHLALIDEADRGTATRLDRLGDVDRLTLVTPDRPGLLQAVAGALAGHNASVLSGVAHTRADGVAIQVWHVRDALAHGIDDRRWSRMLVAVRESVDGAFDADALLSEVLRRYPEEPHPPIATHVQIDNHASRDYSVLEVSAADRRGLLYSVTRVLHAEGIDIHLAKVDTIGPEVVDAFYVRRAGGQRIEDPGEIEWLCRAVREAIGQLER